MYQKKKRKIARRPYGVSMIFLWLKIITSTNRMAENFLLFFIPDD